MLAGMKAGHHLEDYFSNPPEKRVKPGLRQWPWERKNVTSNEKAKPLRV